jgi:hypothetical protein
MKSRVSKPEPGVMVYSAALNGCTICPNAALAMLQGVLAKLRIKAVSPYG